MKYLHSFSIFSVNLFVVFFPAEVDSIGCFVCFSFNGSDPSCEDTFNSTILHKESSRIDVGNYHYPCWALKKKRHGLFPADHCIKVNGHRSMIPFLIIVTVNLNKK